MPKPYPTTGRPVEPVQPERPPAPASVLNAVKLMYAGAGAATVSLVIFVASIGAFRNAVKTMHPRPGSAQVNNYLIQTIAILVISVALWLWMARANSRGRNWARTVSTVLFVLATLDLLLGLIAYPVTPIGLVLPIVTWLIGLGAIIFLWRRESTEFFRPPGRA